MYIEMTALLAVSVSGCLVLLSLGVRGLSLPFLGFCAGSALMVTVGGTLALLDVSTAPPVILGILVVLSAGSWYFSQRAQGGLKAPGLPALLTWMLFLAVIPLLRFGNWTTFTPDSLGYIGTGSLLGHDRFALVSPWALRYRLLATSILHSPASITNDLYLPAVTPLLGIGTLGALAWFVSRGVGRLTREPRIAAPFAICGVLFLLTIPQFVYHAFYINGHLLYAMLLLLIVGSGWLEAIRADAPHGLLIALRLIAIPALVVTRPEASLFVIIAMLPALTSDRISSAHRASMLIVFGISSAAWHGFLWRAHTVAAEPVPFTAVGMFVVGWAALIMSPFAGWRQATKYSRGVLFLVEGGIWLALGVSAVLAPNIFHASMRATIINVGLDGGNWGISLTMLGLLVAAAVMFVHFRGQVFLRFPITTFVPFGLLLAFVRGGAYRVGQGDSLNRMLFHIVPLAVLFVVAAAASGRWRLPRITKPLAGWRDGDQLGFPAARQ